MKPIILTLTPEEAQSLMAIVDLALKHSGVVIMVAAHALVDKLQAAVAESQKSGELVS